MPAIGPSPQSWTLRLKNNRTTLLLHVDPRQRLSSVKSEILKAVQQTHPDGRLNGVTIPTAADDILLAKPVDINDLEAGWESIDAYDTHKQSEAGESGKGKGKAAASASSSKANGTNNSTPQSVGLRDGGIVAFKFRMEREKMYAEWERLDKDGDEDDDEVNLAGEGELEEWDVIVPSMEELYGESLPVEEESEEGG